MCVGGSGRLTHSALYQRCGTEDHVSSTQLGEGGGRRREEEGGGESAVRSDRGSDITLVL